MEQIVIRVLVVDDHPITLDGMSTALAREPDIQLVAEARSVSEAAAALTTHEVTVALVDFRLPDGSAMDVLMLAEGLPHPPAVLILSAFDAPQYVDAAIQLGAAGFLSKTAPLQQILESVRAAARGSTTFTVGQLRGAHSRPWNPLTEREAGIVAGVIAGRSNDELSADLHISKKTVESYLTRLFERHDVSTRVELAVKASREGWLEIPHPPSRRGR
jgi:DNA-binding NarL/FixJ family response regulator